jgi:hypothetical protein
MPTTIDLTIGGYAVTWDPTTTTIDELLAAVKAARAAGAEPRKAWQGKQPQGRRITPPAWDALGNPCCPEHQTPLKFRSQIAGGKYLCQHCGTDGKFDCRYGLSESELSPFVAARFFAWAAKYGVQDIADAQRAGLKVSETATLAEWRAAARALAAANRSA